MDKKRLRLRDIIAQKSFSGDGKFKLASGKSSAFYFDMKPTIFDPEGASLAADLILNIIADEEIDCVGGMAVGAIPLVSALVQASFKTIRPIPGFLVRKEIKERGTRKKIEGNIVRNGKTLIVEDVTTTGGSAMQAIEAARLEANARISIVITLVDRLQGAKEFFAQQNIKLISLYDRNEFIG
tara:strand:+ start:414 stop:962 length:549 start_codon:yes stop_codon:yes gene_type:complete